MAEDHQCHPVYQNRLLALFAFFFSFSSVGEMATALRLFMHKILILSYFRGWNLGEKQNKNIFLSVAQFGSSVG